MRVTPIDTDGCGATNEQECLKFLSVAAKSQFQCRCCICPLHLRRCKTSRVVCLVDLKIWYARLVDRARDQGSKVELNFPSTCQRVGPRCSPFPSAETTLDNNTQQADLSASSTSLTSPGTTRKTRSTASTATNYKSGFVPTTSSRWETTARCRALTAMSVQRNPTTTAALPLRFT